MLSENAKSFIEKYKRELETNNYESFLRRLPREVRIELVQKFYTISLNPEAPNFLSNMKTLPGMLFSETDIQNIKIPDNVTQIEAYCFASCDKLESVILPKNLKVIPRNCFENCINLQKVILPKAIVKIQQDAFKGCDQASIYIDKEAIPNLRINVEDVSYFKQHLKLKQE